MKRIFILLGVLWLSCTHALSGQDYLERFMAYTRWSQNLPEQPDENFIQFIDSDTPLAKKLRERWLYQLARQKNWSIFSQHYKNSDDINLQCFAHMANYYQQNTEPPLAIAKSLWLTGDSMPGACNPLFDLLLKSENFDEKLISERIALALDKRNFALARFLLKQYKEPRLKDEQSLVQINQNPLRIGQLQPGKLHDIFYLFGLKRLVSINMDQAIAYWKNPQTKKLLTYAQQQSFLTHVALYKAMRNHDDANEWFLKINPAFYTDALLDWQIRLALKREQWVKVKKLINHFQDKENPCWQYWLARAMEKTGEGDKARELYQSLAGTRHYYGFLASLRLNKKFSFQNEEIVTNMAVLTPYKPFMDNIKFLYNNKQSLQASRLLNDFISELPKDDKSALIYWIDTSLQWHGKSVFLSNNEEMANQLALRFPLPYNGVVNSFSKIYQIPVALIYAIIRQESGFRDDVVSPAGARGLMQVMPATASVVAKQEKISYSNKDQLFSSQKNIVLGVAYLKHLARHFIQHPVLMAAAYNAGPRQVNYWLKNHPPKEMDIWIETLPWHETRNYLKNVISFYVVYQYRMQNKSDLRSLLKPLV
ncbi:MAG: transglycosylase SLT domain-containing protein [Legionella sp.]|nr:transglycosylase SLT domain-containing protein [Legionella sp.]